MAYSLSLTTPGVFKWGSSPCSHTPPGKFGMRVTRLPSSSFRVRAVQDDETPRRLIDIIRIPPSESALWWDLSSRGLYVAQTISLSFGALGVNDVIAAVLCVLLTEYVTRFYYTRPKVTFPVALLNNFKMGFTYGLFIDAFKLAS
ncbi:hypothetical protein EUGRSUZ_A02837 [Eucalyptus grandis]|uniref:Ycf20-like protein n=2 Tax=Eucalyptus grandis TaxID=71139 RepID=A0A059DK44_EUCGR|nr:hypothetical protein EUGRSUZ_A02837 [Eucalyptus grandis]